MTRLWLTLGLINLLAAIGVFINQILRFNVWWERDEFLHHETFIVTLFYAGIILLIVTLVDHSKDIKGRR